jgi:CNT family concentrative nucleoside transporter
MFDAIAGGTSDGLTLALNVGAMLISFLALLALLNAGLGYVGVLVNSVLVLVGIPALLPALSMNLLFSYLFAPFGYLMGFTGDELFKVGQLLGTKVAVNELIAYSMMGTMELSERAVTIMTYALCGFSNFSCIGIQIGGIGALVPEKRQWLTQLGLYAVLGGTLSNLLSAMVATILL